jgi:hypothetical protein
MAGWADGWQAGLGRARWRLGRAEAVPAHLTVSGLGQHYGPSWGPRHGTVYEPGPALALYGTGRDVPGPCFLVSCPGRPTVLVPYGHL